MRHLRSLATVIAFSAVALGGNGAPASAQSYYTTGTYTIDAAHSVFGDATVGQDSSGTLLDGTNLNSDVLFVVTGVNFTLQEATATPEPGSMALLLGPLVVLGGIAARKRISQRRRRSG